MNGRSADLPWRCHVVVPGLPRGHNVAIVERGVDGVRFTSLDFGDCRLAPLMVRALNALGEISPRAERAMLLGAFLGWECVGTLTNFR
jgi:2-keto-3-deoxy-galactonokinase